MKDQGGTKFKNKSREFDIDIRVGDSLLRHEDERGVFPRMYTPSAEAAEDMLNYRSHQ